MSRIVVYGGKFVDPLHMSPSDISIETIAHALAQIPRFNGHLQRFYSVAQHSVLVAERVWTQTHSASITLRALLHDASEAYICAFSFSGLARSQRLIEAYAQAEDRIMRAVYEHHAPYGVLNPTLAELETIRQADDDLLFLEATQLGNWSPRDWGLKKPSWHRRINPYLNEAAKLYFLRYYEELLVDIQEARYSPKES